MASTRFAAVTIAAALTLTGCATTAVTPDSAYLETLREADSSYNEVPDAELIGVGHDVCDYYKAGGDTVGYLVVAKEAGLSNPGTLAGAAIGAYCPEFSGSL